MTDNARRARISTVPLISEKKKRGSADSSPDGNGTHRHTDRIIKKFMDRKMENMPPETQSVVRKQSLFQLVERKKSDKKQQPKGFKKFLRKIRKFNTIIAFLFLVVYVNAGAVLFWKIESESSEEIESYNTEITKKSRTLFQSISDQNCPMLKKLDKIEDNACLKEIYDLLYNLSPPKKINSFLDGLAYVLTCITTIGYGQLVCHTVAGKLITVVYGILGIALTIYVLRHNGEIALKACNQVLKLFSCCLKLCSKTKTEFKMSITKGMIVLFVFWSLGSIIIASYEKFVFWDAMYFSFSTFSTIGFGDLVPSSHVSGAIIITLHFIDLSLVSMVFVLIHQTMENNFMKVLELLDEGYRKHTNELNTANLESPGGSVKNGDLISTAREKEKS